MSSSKFRRRVGVAVAAAAFGVPLVVGAAIGSVGSQGATVSEHAIRITPPVGDLVSVYDSGALDASTEVAAIAAAQQVGAEFAVRQAASLSMRRVMRGSTVVQAAPATMSFPMGTTVLDVDVIRRLMGPEVSGVMSANAIVMSSRTAGLRGAERGDVVTLLTAFGSEVDFTIGAVVPDEITGGTELLLTPEASARLFLSRKSSVVMWGFESRESIDEALADNGLVSTRIRIRRSWDPFDPDAGLGMARTKELLGEFAFRVNTDGSVTQETSWQAANLPSGRRLLNDFVAIRARCHLVIEPALRDAFAEIASIGAHTAFDLGHANTAGGCHNARFSRLSNSPSIGFLSRHSWGMAIDTNTVGSCQGCAPPNFVTRPGGCDAVRIMRKHGFAWGGNYLTPDGMHFEYVGERRDQLPYPSRYCPNIVTGDNSFTAEVSQRATIFDDAGLVPE